jgi:hypothetical protein
MTGETAIPVSELLAYVTYHRIDGEYDRYRLEHLISAMDSEMLTLHNKKES